MANTSPSTHIEILVADRRVVITQGGDAAGAQLLLSASIDNLVSEELLTEAAVSIVRSCVANGVRSAVRSCVADEIRAVAGRNDKSSASYTAYAILILDTSAQPAKVKYARVFGEAAPTVISHGVWTQATLFSVTRPSFTAAMDAAWDRLRHSAYAWIGDLNEENRSRVAQD